MKQKEKHNKTFNCFSFRMSGKEREVVHFSLGSVNHALSALDISPIRSHLTSGVGMAAKLSKICDGINKTELNVEELLPIDC